MHDEGGVLAQRTAQVARLVSTGEVELAVTFAGEDPSLQAHLVGLLCAAGKPTQAAQLVRLRRLPDALLAAALQGRAWSGSDRRSAPDGPASAGGSGGEARTREKMTGQLRAAIALLGGSHETAAFRGTECRWHDCRGI